MGLNCCKEVVDAVFVIPFTAGRLSQLKSGNRKSERKEKVHDGSISGIIILTSILVVTLVVLFGIASFEHPTDKTFAGSSIGSKQIYLSICFLVAAVTCIIFMIVHRPRNSVASMLLHKIDFFSGLNYRSCGFLLASLFSIQQSR